MPSLLLYISLLTASGAFHPVHISVSNAEISQDSIRMTLRSFSDDLQVAYFHFHSSEIDYSNDENLHSEWLTNYIENSFQLVALPKNDTIRMEVQRVWHDRDALVFELRGKMPEIVNSLYIYNGFLLDIYSDQSNLMIFGFSGSERGMKFDIRNKKQELKLRN